MDFATRYHASPDPRGLRWAAALEEWEKAPERIAAILTPQGLLQQADHLAETRQEYGQDLRWLGQHPSKGNATRQEYLKERLDAMAKAGEQLRHGDSAQMIEELKHNLRHLLMYQRIFVSQFKEAENAPKEKRLREMARVGSRIAQKYYQTQEDTPNMPRYQRLGRIFDLGESHIFDLQDFAKQVELISLMPYEVRLVKWGCSLALSDAVFDLNLNDHHSEVMQVTDRKMLAHLYTRMSEHRRGESNPAMPESQKFRHGPAIHSLCTAALLDKWFASASSRMAALAQDLRRGRSVEAIRQKAQEMGLENPPTGFSELLAELNTAREKLIAMRGIALASALVHDGGENRGELSFGSDKYAKIDTVRKDQEGRNEEEEMRYLQLVQRTVARIAREPDTIMDAMARQQMVERWMTFYHQAEDKHTFLGRLGKVAECIQSQHDYLNKNAKGGEPLNEQSDVARNFSLGYVEKHFHHIPSATMDQLKETHSPVEFSALNLSNYAGPDSLKRLAGRGERMEKFCQSLLFAEAERENNALKRFSFLHFRPEEREELRVRHSPYLPLLPEAAWQKRQMDGERNAGHSL